MPNITIEIEPSDDPDWDKAWPITLATGEYLAKVLGMPVTVADGYGTAQDFDPASS